MNNKQFADYWIAHRAAKAAIEACKNATGLHRQIDTYVSANQIAEYASELPTECAGLEPPATLGDLLAAIEGLRRSGGRYDFQARLDWLYQLAERGREKQ